MSRTPAGLKVSFTVRNPNPTKIWVCDKLVVPGDKDGFWKRSDRGTVSKTDDPDVVLFSLGPRGNDLEVDELYRPVYVEVEANKEHSGSFTVPLPLKSWSPENRMKPLPANPTKARLDVYYLPTAPKGVEKLKSTDAKPLEVPSGYTSMMTFEFAAQPIPK